MFIYTLVSWSEAREWCENSNDAEKRHMVNFEVPDELDYVYGLRINAFSGKKNYCNSFKLYLLLHGIYCTSIYILYGVYAFEMNDKELKGNPYWTSGR